jgi:hypothetical protein
VTDRLAAYRDEVLRWNASINLVSRRDTARRLEALMDQCHDAAVALVAAGPPLGLGPAADLLYLDVGAGGGLPGVAWHELLVREGRRVTTWFIEPRDKRAWFLARVARELAPTCGVLRGLCGDVAPPTLPSASQVLVSLKALRLDDGQVLAGLAPFVGAAADLVIARFHPPDQAWTADLVHILDIPETGAYRTWPGGTAMACGAGLLGPAGPDPTAASLVVSRYRLEPA